MSKAERYIELVSDENGHLCDQHALKAVEIAREEIIEWIRNNVRNYAFMVTDEFEGDVDVDALIKDLKQAMKDE